MIVMAVIVLQVIVYGESIIKIYVFSIVNFIYRNLGFWLSTELGYWNPKNFYYSTRSEISGRKCGDVVFH